MATRNKKRNRKQQNKQRPEQPKSQNVHPLWMRIVEVALAFPRIIRILLAGIFSLAVTLVVGLVFYFIDVRFLLSIDGTVTTRLMIPVVVATILGLIMYIAGWVYYVGGRGVDNTVRIGILWYLLVGIISIILSIIWGIWIMLVF